MVTPGEGWLLVGLAVFCNDGAVDGAENGTDGGTVDVVALAHAEYILAVGGLQMDVAHGLRIGAGGDGRARSSPQSGTCRSPAPRWR